MSVIFFPSLYIYIYIYTFCYSIIEPHYLLIFYIFFSFLNFSSHYYLRKNKNLFFSLLVHTYVRLHFIQPFSSLFASLPPPPLLTTSPLHFLHDFHFFYNLTLLPPILFVHIYGYTPSNHSLPSLPLYLPHYSLLQRYNSFIIFPFL